MADARITIDGNLTDAPELRFTPSGAAVANFTVASTPRTYDRQSSEWKDGETVFLRVSVWRDLAEGAAETLVKGDTVIVTGKLKQTSYEKDGQKRTSYEIDGDFVGKSVRPRKQRGEDYGRPAQADAGGW